MQAYPSTVTLRWFQPPLPPSAWTDVFNATQLGNACWQNIFNGIQLTHPWWTRYSEDCLHLNVYSKQV